MRANERRQQEYPDWIPFLGNVLLCALEQGNKSSGRSVEIPRRVRLKRCENKERSRLKVCLCLGIKQTLHLLQRAQNVEHGLSGQMLPPHPSPPHTHTPLFYLSTGTSTNTTVRSSYKPQGSQRSGPAPLEAVNGVSALAAGRM